MRSNKDCVHRQCDCKIFKVLNMALINDDQHVQ